MLFFWGFFHQIMYHKTLGSTTVFNIDINKKLFLNIESAYQSDFWIMAELEEIAA